MTERDRAGRVPLHYAANDGQPDLVVELLAAGQDVDVRDDANWTPLHFASQKKNPRIVETLLDAGADIEAENNLGQSPLMLSTSSSASSGDIMMLLYRRGADPNHAMGSGHTPLWFMRETLSPPIKQNAVTEILKVEGAR